LYTLLYSISSAGTQFISETDAAATLADCGHIKHLGSKNCKMQ